jgi:hypothetical protein
LCFIECQTLGDCFSYEILHFVVIIIRMDESRQPLSRKIAIPSSQINPYRMIIILRVIVVGFFFHYRIMHPVDNAYALWLVSVICEIWFTLSWILDQFSKWFPVIRETYLDRLSLRQVIALIIFIDDFFMFIFIDNFFIFV